MGVGEESDMVLTVGTANGCVIHRVIRRGVGSLLLAIVSYQSLVRTWHECERAIGSGVAGHMGASQGHERAPAEGMTHGGVHDASLALAEMPESGGPTPAPERSSGCDPAAMTVTCVGAHRVDAPDLSLLVAMRFSSSRSS